MRGESSPDGDGINKPEPARPLAEFSTPGRPSEGYTDGRGPWDWKSKYDPEARIEIAHEERRLLVYLFLSLGLVSLSLLFNDQEIRVPLAFNTVSPDGNSQQIYLAVSCHILAQFFSGWVGGTTFSLKWLVHACPTGKWLLDRRPWQPNVPLLGGVYSCVMVTLLDAGMFGHGADASRPVAVSAAFAFLVGYFSDGVSGLLSNIANAVFGTLEKK